MTPHFYNLRSRLGIANVPHRQKELNIGVEEGGDAILMDNFLKNFPTASVEVFDFPRPEEVKKEEYYSTLAKYLKDSKDLILNSLKQDEVPVVVGGDNSVSFPALLSILEKEDARKVGYIRIDSHPDMNSIATSPSGNFHGMWMRPFVDSFEEKQITNLIHKKLSLSQLVFIGNLDIDPGEEKFFQSGGAQTFSPYDLRENKEGVFMLLEQFVTIHDHIYLGIDIDGFDASIAPATGIPAQKGLLLRDVEYILKKAKEHLICVDLVEVNPKKPGAKKTVELAQVLLTSLF